MSKPLPEWITDLEAALGDIQVQREELDAQEGAVRDAITALKRVQELRDGVAIEEKPTAPARKPGRPVAESKGIEKLICRDCGGPARPNKNAKDGKVCIERCNVRRTTVKPAPREERVPVVPVLKQSAGVSLPAVEVPPLRAKDMNMAPCGNCRYRMVDGRKLLSSQPDCPIHGTGLGVAQPGREQKAAPAVG